MVLQAELMFVECGVCSRCYTPKRASLYLSDWHSRVI